MEVSPDTQSQATISKSVDSKCLTIMEQIMESMSQNTNTDSAQMTFTIPNVSKTGADKDQPTEVKSSTDSYVSDTEWPDLNLPGHWGNFGLESDPWNDEVKPFVNVRKYEEIVLNAKETEGILSERIVASCSSYLDRCPYTGRYVLCKCSLGNKNLVDIGVVTFHHYLQYLDLSRNKLTHLQPLGELPFLMHLDVSHNKLTELLDFKPPFNLTYVNYSHNQVRLIQDLSEFWSIVHMDLSHNAIFLIAGFDRLKYLRYLNLSHNTIKIVQGLDHLRLKVLNLAHNEIEFYEEGVNAGLKTLNDLLEINMNSNKLKTLKLFKGLQRIRKICVASNNIASLVEMENLKDMQFLTNVDLRRNPVTALDSYYETCIYNLQVVRCLDGECVDAEAKVNAKNSFGTSASMNIAKKHSQMLLLEQMVNFNISQAIVPVGKHMPPIIVLVGPPGSGQDKIMRQFYRLNEKHLKIGVSHTTRAPNDGEIEGESYYFVSSEEFLEMSKKGELLNVFEFLGCFYGISRNELAKVTEGKCALLLHTDLTGATGLKLRNLRCQFVLLLLSEDNKNYSAIMQKYCYTYWISKKAKAIQIINDPITQESGSDHSGCSVCSEIEGILTDLLSWLPDEPERPVVVKFQDEASVLSNGAVEIDPAVVKYGSRVLNLDNGELVPLMEYNETKRHSVSFAVPDDKLYHSISEAQFSGSEHFFSVVSEACFARSDDSLKRTIKRRIEANEHIENFIAKTAALRKAYIDFNDEHPGFFREVIYSDKSSEAMRKLSDLLKTLIGKEKKPLHTYDYYKDEVFEDMISDRLKYLYNEMDKHLYVSEKLTETTPMP